ncbi:MAG: sensor domain-containing protein [Candidatus Eisenbacteria bacterium]|nr:sensor domain-containing protein [Candidatus Eisenbacteria bacterium]
MIKSIDEYLALLKKELAGADPATIQDALSDSEEHLRIALGNAIAASPRASETEALQPIVEKYGLPAEVAAAFMEIEARTPTGLARPALQQRRSSMSRFFGVIADPRAWGAFLYMLFSLATGIIYFTWAVTGISLSASLLVLVIGLPFVGLFLLSVRGIAFVEGRVVEALLGVRMPRRSLFSEQNLGWWGHFKSLVSEKRTWMTLAYMVLQLPIGIIYFTVATTLLALSVGLMAQPVMQLVFHFPVAQIDDAHYYVPGALLPLVVLGGILLLVVTMHLVKSVGKMHGALAKTMLVME